MKPVNELMKTMGNLPAVEVAPLRIDTGTADVVNALFKELQAIFPAWRQAWPDDEALKAAKRSWIKAFMAQGITQIEQIRFGIEKCRKLQKPFAPSVGEFIAMCQPTPEDFGMPAGPDAWLEALLGTYSHEAVRLAARETGLFDLRAARQEDKGLRERFNRNYEIILRRAIAGQPLDGKVLTGIGHDSQKTELELANEQAERQAQARIVQQGIPANGAAARAQLLSRMKIKRQSNGEGRP